MKQGDVIIVNTMLGFYSGMGTACVGLLLKNYLVLVGGALIASTSFILLLRI
jgi:NAD/NADP transhydrogenase beta subunit